MSWDAPDPAQIAREHAREARIAAKKAAKRAYIQPDRGAVIDHTGELAADSPLSPEITAQLVAEAAVEADGRVKRANKGRLTTREARNRYKRLVQRARLLVAAERVERKRRQLQDARLQQRAEYDLAAKMATFTPDQKATVRALVEIALDDETKGAAIAALRSNLRDRRMVVPALKFAALVKGELAVEDASPKVTVVLNSDVYTPGMFRSVGDAMLRGEVIDHEGLASGRISVDSLGAGTEAAEPD